MDKEKTDKENKRLFIASSELFSTFQTEIQLTNISSIDEIIIIFRNRLKEVFIKNSLEILASKVDKCPFHIHSYDIEQILTSNVEDSFYICDHCE